MATWGEFESASPELAAFGRAYFGSGAAYLATVRKDGAPRVHPVTAVVAGGHLLLRMEPTSPKRHDLRGDGRYTLHAAVSDPTNTSGEFMVEGSAVQVDDPEVRALAPPEDTYTLLFELLVHLAFSTTYENGEPDRRVWREG
jgi:hypothetical protein